MQSLSSEVDAPRRRSRVTLWLVLAVCAAPLIASYVAYYAWRPSGHVNYGELVEPHPLHEVRLRTLEDQPFAWADLKGRWVLLTIASADCDERCRRDLVYTRQVRLAQGKESGRIERVWLLTDTGSPDPQLITEHPGLRIVRVGKPDIGQLLEKSRSEAGRIYVVDPLGNLMMRFPRDPDPRRMLRDVARLLRHSRWK